MSVPDEDSSKSHCVYAKLDIGQFYLIVANHTS